MLLQESSGCDSSGSSTYDPRYVAGGNLFGSSAIPFPTCPAGSLSCQTQTGCAIPPAGSPPTTCTFTCGTGTTQQTFTYYLNAAGEVSVPSGTLHLAFLKSGNAVCKDDVGPFTVPRYCNSQSQCNLQDISGAKFCYTPCTCTAVTISGVPSAVPDLCPGAAFTLPAVTATDDCGNPLTVQAPTTSPSPASLCGATTYTYTASCSNGVTNSASFTLSRLPTTLVLPEACPFQATKTNNCPDVAGVYETTTTYGSPSFDSATCQVSLPVSATTTCAGSQVATVSGTKVIAAQCPALP
jgi:hypothetical protein